MKLLVTGGAGFIGSNFIRYWLREHVADRVVNIDKFAYGIDAKNLNDIKEGDHYRFVKRDICDLALVREILSKESIDVIVHFAAQSHVDRSIEYIGKREEMLKSKESSVRELFALSIQDDFTLNNVWGTHILLEAAVQARRKGSKVRFHHVSTDEVFGSLELGTNEKFNEQSPYRPQSPYAASKAAADHLVSAYHVSFGLPVTISNTSNNFGPFQHPEKLLPLAITNLIEGKKVPIYGDGKNVRDWLYVEDHCRAIDLILTKGKPGKTYCIGGMAEDISNLDLIRRVLRILGKGEEMIEFVKDRPGHDRRYAIDWSKAKIELDYEPQFSLDESLEQTVDWYKLNESWWKRIKEGKDFRAWEQRQYGRG